MDRLLYHGSVFMDNVHKVKISVHKVSFLKITVSYLRNGRGGTHPGRRPAATQPAGGHVAGQPCRARCQDATPSSRPVGGAAGGPSGSTKPSALAPGSLVTPPRPSSGACPCCLQPLSRHLLLPTPPPPATAQKEPFWLVLRRIASSSMAPTEVIFSGMFF